MVDSPARVWVVDDDRSIRWVLERALEKAGQRVRTFERAQAVLEALDGGARPDVLLTDIRMPGMDGLELLTQLHRRAPDLPVIVITAHSDLDSAVSAYQGGAFEYLPKPFDVAEAVGLVERAVRTTRAEGQGETGRAARAPEILGESPAMQEVFRAIGRLSRSHVSVLINGESGTGKELVARALHRHSPRSEGGLHRRPEPAARSLRTGRRRHPVPGRNRRHARRTADPPPARAGGRGVLPGGGARTGARGRARHRRHPPGPGGTGTRRPLPRRPLPALRHWVERRLGEGHSGLLDEVVPKVERILIQAALARTGGRRQEAAHLLGWGRNTLTRKIKELGMEAPRGAATE